MSLQFSDCIGASVRPMHRLRNSHSLQPLSLTVLLLAGILAVIPLLAACGGKVGAVSVAPPEVKVIAVEQKDVPIVSEWVATLDGYVNAQIQPQVTGYIIKQNYKEGSPIHNGDVLFEIDPRPFQALLDQAKAQLAHAQAHMG